MAKGIERDQRRLQIGLLCAALAVAAVLALALLQELGSPWRRIQAQYESLGVDSTALGIRELRSEHGAVDRCATCHLGAIETGAELTDLEPHPTLVSGHEPERIGCTACHGGNGRALDPDVAHALPGTSDRDPLLTAPFIEASCARCHVPSIAAGIGRVARGAGLYLELGCAICHPLAAGGRGGWDFGPELRALGRQSNEALRLSLFEPTADYPRSTMPSYAGTLTSDPKSLTDLLAYLQALTLPPLERELDRRVDRPCAECHDGPGGHAGGRLVHRCQLILDRPDLACARCHEPQIPAGTWCPVIREQRDACRACHWQSRGAAVTAIPRGGPTP